MTWAVLQLETVPSQIPSETVVHVVLESTPSRPARRKDSGRRATGTAPAAASEGGPVTMGAPPSGFAIPTGPPPALPTLDDGPLELSLFERHMRLATSGFDVTVSV